MSETSETSLQARVAPWILACFSAEIAADQLERNDRFIEESLELVQSLGYNESRAHALVDYVFSRPPGEPNQEVGGVMITLAALCLAAGLDMDEAGEIELFRINRPEIIDKIRKKQASKPTGSALPIAGISELTAAKARITELETELAEAISATASVEKERADNEYRLSQMFGELRQVKAELARLKAEGEPTKSFSQLGEWFISRDTGVSSEYMAAVHIEGRILPSLWGDSSPGDAPDLGRCVRLVEKVPAIKDSFPIIRQASPVWASYIDNWDELTELWHRNDYNLTTRLMNELRKAAPQSNLSSTNQ